MDRPPIKRHSALQGVSREHHHGLLLCWKIRTGVSKNIPLERIKMYADWFYATYLVPHFELEETHIFPLGTSETSESLPRSASLFRLRPSALGTLTKRRRAPPCAPDGAWAWHAPGGPARVASRERGHAGDLR